MLKVLVPALALAALAGCQNRGADDRVIDQYQRQEMHGPGYTVVAMRRTDPARLSASGNTVILTNGFEPVFATDAAYYEVPVEPVTTRKNESKEMLDRLNALDRKLGAAAGPKAASPSPAKGETLAPAANQLTPEQWQKRIDDNQKALDEERENSRKLRDQVKQLNDAQSKPEASASPTPPPAAQLPTPTEKPAPPAVKTAPPALLARPEDAAAAGRGTSAQDIPETRGTADALRNAREMGKVALASNDPKDIADALDAINLARGQIQRFAEASKAAGSTDDEIEERLAGMHAPETLALQRALRDKQQAGAANPTAAPQAQPAPEADPKAGTKPPAIDTPWQAEKGSK